MCLTASETLRVRDNDFNARDFVLRSCDATSEEYKAWSYYPENSNTFISAGNGCPDTERQTNCAESGNETALNDENADKDGEDAEKDGEDAEKDGEDADKSDQDKLDEEDTDKPVEDNENNEDDINDDDALSALNASIALSGITGE